MTKKIIQIYEYSPYDEQVETAYGKIPYRTFLEKEQERILQNPKRQAEIRTSGKLIALFADKVIW